MRSLFLALLFLLSGLLHAQAPITLEAIWKDFAFYPSSAPGFEFSRDGLHYTLRERNRIIQYDLPGGDNPRALFDAGAHPGENGFSGKMDGYDFSEDEQKILIQTGTERIFRHSAQAAYFVWDLCR